MSTHQADTRLGEARKHLERGNMADAEAACRELVAANKRNANAWQVLGFVYMRRGWFDKAAQCFEKCVKLHPEVPMSHCQLASARMYQGRHDDARREYGVALAKEPDFPVAVRGLAEMMERGGEAEEALARLTPVAERGNADPETLLLYATLTEKAGDPEKSIEIARRALALSAVQLLTRRKLEFAIGKALHRLERYDEAFETYQRANELMSRPFDLDQMIQHRDRIIAYFSAARIADLPRARTETELPVFVVGLPRSGSTLVEQIIDAHPLAYGAGELTTFLEVRGEMPGKIGSKKEDPAWIDDIPPGAIDRLGRPYLNHLVKLGRGATRVVDKNLLNYIHLGLISLLYPRARVIHCRRDPLDIAVSCFVNDLSPVGFSWSSRLLDIGHYIREHERLMEHWTSVLDIRILPVSYEEMVEDQAGVSRRIIDFCGLEWDDACLRFYESGRTVTTLSYDQVRQPIYRSAMQRWKPYDRHLEPLRAGLGSS